MTREHYYINNTPQPNGWDNEVHKKECRWLGQAKDISYLWYFNNCKDAVAKAKETYPTTADGCAHCISECHYH
jgi:hypothetical protein